MENEILDPNMQKYRNYRMQFTRLNRAKKEEFYYEVIFIAYAVMEDRTESILRHCGQWEKFSKGKKLGQLGIHKKIEAIRKLAADPKSPVGRHVGQEILQEIMDWKTERNKLIHALLNQAVSEEELKKIADDGYDLCCQLRTRVNSLKRAIQRKEAAKKS